MQVLKDLWAATPTVYQQGVVALLVVFMIFTVMLVAMQPFVLLQHVLEMVFNLDSRLSALVTSLVSVVILILCVIFTLYRYGKA